MPKKMNGSLKIVTIVITLSVIGAGVVTSYTLLGAKADATAKAVEDNAIDIMINAALTDENTEHRWKFEEKVSNIERDVALILEEVRK